MNKKIWRFFIFAGIIIFILLCFFCYKNSKLGNNKFNKSADGIKDFIFNIDSYVAKVEINVQSNKNSNKYLIEQKYKKGEFEEQIVLKPENIEGLKMSFSSGTLKIDNSRLNLSKIYEGYPYLSNNVLCLSSFIEDYKLEGDNKLNFFEENNEIVFELKCEKNKYSVCRKLFVDKETGKPKKMIVQDYNNRDVIYILYNEIEIK